ncbi:MAG: nucleotidyltransferase family protein [Cyanobacteria bacterium J06560_5]
MGSLLTPTLKLPAAVPREEVQLLQYCAYPHLNQVTERELSLLLQNHHINWRLLLRMAQLHGMMPLLYKTLSSICPEAIPAPILTELKTFFTLNGLRNQALTKELCRLLDLLSSSNIPAIPFKGPILATTTYGSLSLRQFSDLDILIRPQDFVKARNVLLANQYRRAQPMYGMSDLETEEQLWMKAKGEYPMLHTNGQFVIDLHDRLIAGEFPLLSANFDIFWKRLSPISILNNKTQSFCVEDLLLYLCIHGSKDLWRKLSWVCDIATLIHIQPQLNWEKVIARSQSLECEQMLWLGISLAVDLLKVSLPKVAIERMETKFRLQKISHQIQTQLTSGIEPTAIKYTNLQRVFFHGQLVENKADRFRHYLKFLSTLVFRPFTPNIYDKEFISLPHKFYFLYYLIRPLRLVAEFLTSFFRCTIGAEESHSSIKK